MYMHRRKSWTVAVCAAIGAAACTGVVLGQTAATPGATPWAAGPGPAAQSGSAFDQTAGAPRIVAQAGSAPAASAQSGSIPQLVPDLMAGIWAHPMLGFERPVSGPGPVVNLARLPNGVSSPGMFVGDSTNPILNPDAAALVKKRADISRSGVAFPDPDNQCRLEPVPDVLWNFEIQMLQRPDKVTIIYNHDHEFREIRMNQQHPAHVVPTVHGDSVGHYEGDTLVVDTVGISVKPYPVADRFGTPFTEALHVVERYRLIDYQTAVEAQARGFKEWLNIDAYAVDPNFKGKGMQLEFTVEDPNVFTTPWKGFITYRRADRDFWEERICAENIEHFDPKYYSDKTARVPTADTLDFSSGPNRSWRSQKR